MDQSLLLFVNQGWAHPWLDYFFWWISQRTAFSLPLLSLFFVFSVRRFGMDGVKAWVLLIILVLLGDLFGNVLKQITQEARPCQSLVALIRQPFMAFSQPCGTALHGMPSNHALNFFMVAMFTSMILGRTLWTHFIFIVAILVALSRIYLGKHFPSQVLTGALIGMTLGMLAAFFSQRYLFFIRRIYARQHTPRKHAPVYDD